MWIRAARFSDDLSLTHNTKWINNKQSIIWYCIVDINRTLVCCQFRLLWIFLTSLRFHLVVIIVLCSQACMSKANPRWAERPANDVAIFTVFGILQVKSVAVVRVNDCVPIIQLHGCNQKFSSCCFLPFPSFPFACLPYFCSPFRSVFLRREAAPSIQLGAWGSL